jgi:hypothetical protein
MISGDLSGMTPLMETPPNLFCHIHVSKTGGTSLNLLLERWFPAGFEVLDHPDPKYVLETEALGEYLAQRPDLRCISTHHLRMFPGTVAGRKVHYFTILREPLDRAISLLTFMRKFRHEFTDEHKRALPSNFDQMPELEILKRWTKAAASDRSNGGIGGNPVTAMFLGDDFRCDFANNRRACEAAAAAKCIAVLNRFLYIGDFACFEESIRELAQRIQTLGVSACETDQIPAERVSRDVRGDLGWLEKGAPVVDSYMDGLTIDGMVYRHFAQRSRHSAKE